MSNTKMTDKQKVTTMADSDYVFGNFGGKVGQMSIPDFRSHLYDDSPDDESPELSALKSRISSVEDKNTEQDERINAAQETANSARETATAASAAAQEAKSTATAAQTTAHEAQTTAAALLQDTPWEGRHMNMFTETGEYHIHGERTDANDGLPILNAASGHTIDARLTVLDSSLTGGTGAKTDIVVTQILRLSNRTGGDGHVYVRTAQAATKAELTATDSTKWGTWEKLMGIFEKNVVANATDLDTYTTNGMYSGLFNFSGPYKQHYGLVIPAGSTFLMVTINGYAVAAYGAVPQLTQMLYLLPAKTGSEQFPAKMYIRTAWWNASAKDWVWNYWDKIVTANELSALEARVTALEKK